MSSVLPGAPRVVTINPAIGTRGDLHVYLPENASAEAPVRYVLGIHGGAWVNGDQTSYHYLWPKLAPLGFGLVLASYRTVKEAPFPAAYDDLLAVLRWLKESGGEHGLDPERALLFGSSAGGHLAMLLATRALAEGAHAPKILGIAEYCGILDLAGQYDWDARRGSQMVSNFMNGETPQSAPELYRAASPLAHVHRGMPPVWMTHGSGDPTVPFAQSQEMVRQLRELEHDVIFLEARGLGHTLREMTFDGQAIEPIEMLFERDLLRFFERVSS